MAVWPWPNHRVLNLKVRPAGLGVSTTMKSGSKRRADEFGVMAMTPMKRAAVAVPNSVGVVRSIATDRSAGRGRLHRDRGKRRRGRIHRDRDERRRGRLDRHREQRWDRRERLDCIVFRAARMSGLCRVCCVHPLSRLPGLRRLHRLCRLHRLLQLQRAAQHRRRPQCAGRLTTSPSTRAGAFRVQATESRSARGVAIAHRIPPTTALPAILMTVASTGGTYGSHSGARAHAGSIATDVAARTP